MGQTSRVWFKKFTTVITSLDLYSSGHNSTLFVKTTSHNHILLSPNIDDMMITYDGRCLWDIYLKLQLVNKFEMKDICSLHYFLEIEVAYSLEATFS